MFSHSTALQGATPAAQAGGAAGQARRRAILASAARSEGRCVREPWQRRRKSDRLGLSNSPSRSCSPALPRRELLLASLCTAAAAATGCLPPTAAAAVPPAQELSGAALAPAAEAAATGGVGDVTPIYFGNGGCVCVQYCSRGARAACAPAAASLLPPRLPPLVPARLSPSAAQAASGGGSTTMSAPKRRWAGGRAASRRGWATRAARSAAPTAACATITRMSSQSTSGWAMQR